MASAYTHCVCIVSAQAMKVLDAKLAAMAKEVSPDSECTSSYVASMGACQETFEDCEAPHSNQ